MIIYKISKSCRYSSASDHSQFEVDRDIAPNEFYLYRENWKINPGGDFEKLVSNNFVKVVNTDWLSNHPDYYGHRIFDDTTPEKNGLTQYLNFIQGNI